MESVKISPKKCKIAMALAGHHTLLIGQYFLLVFKEWMQSLLSAGLAEHVADLVIVLCSVYACDPVTLVPLTIWGRNDSKVGAGWSSGQQAMRTMRCMTFANCRPQTADRRPQTADRRPQTADRRSQIADCKLNDTNNLPNKGDIIKNITSCESEKVAWSIFLRKVTLDSFPRCCWLFFFDPFSTHPAYH